MPPVVRPPEPLDVAALKLRLRETSAIGVFTKLALSNQMDDLVQQFHAHHLGERKNSVATLRQAYELLVLKVSEGLEALHGSVKTAASVSLRHAVQNKLISALAHRQHIRCAPT